MLIELHAHTTKHSACSKIDPVTLVTQCVSKGLQGLVLSEHHYLWTEEEIEALRLEAGAERHFLIFAAQEIETDLGHVVVIGAGKPVKKGTSVSRIKAMYPDCATVWAHPFRNGSLPDKAKFSSRGLDAVEIFSLNHTAKENYAGLKLWHEMKFTAVSGSDTHTDKMVGVIPTHFDHNVKTVEELALEIREGRCRPFYKEVPKAGGNSVVTEITLGPKGEDETRQRIIVRNISNERKWKKAVRAVRTMETLEKKGFSKRQFRVPAVIDINEDERLIIEEGQRGKSLFEVLQRVNRSAGIKYIEMAAQWLAKLHGLRIRPGSAAETEAREEKRFSSYSNAAEHLPAELARDFRSLIEFTRSYERELFKTDAAGFVLVHGDFHPKNIIIGQELAHDPATVYASVIDFSSSLSFLPEFDVGYFISQFASQFRDSGGILRQYGEKTFLDAYAEAAGAVRGGPAPERIEFFRVRANLSIAAYLIKMGMGTSEKTLKTIKDSLEIRNGMA
ncbi:MAG: phosphotransferase [Endomicrobiales bacterium]|nr:phosphotransferase [Endomicrobiales bacterium]